VSRPIEDYALIGDCQTAALVARDGSIDWLCLPRFDSAACFAALLGTEEHGFWRIAPAAPTRRVTRRYRGDTLVLETEFDVDGGATLAVIDFMPPRTEAVDLCRVVEARRGQVPVEMILRMRFDYGAAVPWVRREDGALLAVAGPDSLRLRTDMPVRGEGLSTVSHFTLGQGQRAVFDLTWAPSHRPAPAVIDPLTALADTGAWWHRWSSRSRYQGPWQEAVTRSLITLKALTYMPTGGIVAAPTTSLPERLGGVRNWDYRYCWLRDATFTLLALQGAGYHEEARDFRGWLLRAAAGSPSQLQIMYGIAGERRLPELELPWLPGYESSRPVRIGNQAHSQLQLDVYGELLDALHKSWPDLPPDAPAWNLERAVVEYLETIWQQPDEGIWEVRGPRRHFTHSKVMAWVALDRAVKGVESFGQPGPLERWRRLRDQIHADVCQNGYNAARGSFVQFYGSDLLDASLLMLPTVGFLPTQDPRVRGTIEAIERELLQDGFVARYPSLPEVDGLPSGEGAFLLCTFWLADCLILLGRREDAVRLFERVLAVRNDLGLLSECYDPKLRRLLGNFPQAFSHVGLINTARNLAEPRGPARQRAEH
jgi:GH15 family glucan-1,4-alpha-glucosidase